MAIGLAKKKEEDKSTEYNIDESWKKFIRQIEAAKKTWEEIADNRKKIDLEKSKLSMFARRSINIFGRQTFEKMFPDFLKYVIQSGGFKTIK